MRKAILEAPKNKRVTVNGFEGFKVGDKASPSEIMLGENITIVNGRIAPRSMRMRVRDVTSADGISSDGELIWVESGRLYYMGVKIDSLTLTEGKKQIFRIGNYVVVFPDGAYFNLTDMSDCGDISVTFMGSGEIEISTVDENGDPVDGYTVSYLEPLDYREGDLWAIPNADVGYVLKKCIRGAWREIKTYIKISAASIDAPFSVGDAVDCYGAESITGKAFRIAKLEKDAVYCEGVSGGVSKISSIKLSRKMPLLDYVAVCGDRLWGCRSGFDADGNMVRRVYASAKGNPLIWTARADGFGVLRDIPSDGAFSGMCEIAGYTVVFENNALTKLRITEEGVTDKRYACEGVGDMAFASIATLGGEIYYKSKNAVCVYNGSRVKCISSSLGKVGIPKTGSYAGVMNGRYYVTLLLENGKNAVGVYDPETETWEIQDDPGVRGFATRNGELYAICEDSYGARILLWDYQNSSVEAKSYCVDGGGDCDIAECSFELGNIGADSLGHVYPVKLSIRAIVRLGELRIGLKYNGEMEKRYTIGMSELGVYNIPIQRKRADTVSVSFLGSGDFDVCGYELEYIELGTKVNKNLE